MREEIINTELGIPVYISGTSVTGNCYQASGRLSEMHGHKEYEFIRLDAGTLRCQTLDKEFMVEQGDVLFINSHIPHSTFITSSSEQDTVIQFGAPIQTETAFHYIARFMSLCDTPLFLFKAEMSETAKIQKYLAEIVNEYSLREPFWDEYIHSNIHLLIASLRRYGILSDTAYKNSDKFNKLKPVLEYINENYSEDISTAKLCDILHFNETYFCRFFKDIVGTNPINYINFVRVCKAAHLLKTNMGLSEIIGKTGFSSLSYFNRIFRKVNHCSPSEYKKILKKRELIT